MECLCGGLVYMYMEDVMRKVNDWIQRRGVTTFGPDHRECFPADETMFVFVSV